MHLRCASLNRPSFSNWTAVITSSLIFISTQSARADHNGGLSFKQFRQQTEGLSRHAARQQFRNEYRSSRNGGRVLTQPVYNFVEEKTAAGRQTIPIIPRVEKTISAQRVRTLGRTAQSNAVGNVVRTRSGIDFYLASSQRNISLGKNLFDGLGSVEIQVGGETKTVTAGTQVTAAEYIAVKQVLANGEQKLSIDKSGSATGGEVNLEAITGTHDVMRASNLLVSNNVTTIGDFARGSNFRILGDLNNYGTVRAISSEASVKSGSIRADDINNFKGATITSSIDLTLQANGDLNNRGAIVSSAGLNVSAGGAITNSGTITAENDFSSTASAINNRGLIQSNSGQVNFDSNGSTVLSIDNSRGTISATNGSVNFGTQSISTTMSPGHLPVEINISNVQGIIQARQGSINIGNAQASSTINLSGGDWLSKELKVTAGEGEIAANVEKVTGVVHSVAGLEHFTADTNVLVLGNNCITGDPTFANTGSITIQGTVSANEALAIIAGGDIVATSTGQVINTSGAPTYLIAGADIISGGGTGGQTITGGSSGVATPVTIRFNNSFGGNIDFSNSAVGTVISTNGGALNLFANSNANTNGNVWMPATAKIDTTSSTGDGGSLVVLANGTGGTQAASGEIIAESIRIGDIVTTGKTGSGDVTIRTSQPTITSGANATFAIDGSTTAVFGPGDAVEGSSVRIASVDTSGSNGADSAAQGVNGSNGNAGGNLTIQSSGDLFIGALDLRGGSGGDGFSDSVAGSAGGYGGKGGTVQLDATFIGSSMTTLTIGTVNMSGGVGGAGGASGAGGLSGDGGDGGAGGLFHANSKIMNLNGTITGSGGAGGLGGASGNGGTTGDGGNGGHAGSILLNCINLQSFATVLNGGDAGLSAVSAGSTTGSGGTGGIGGDIIVFSTDSIGSATNPIGPISLDGGSGGNGASAGAGGKGGSLQLFANLGSLFATTFTARGGDGAEQSDGGTGGTIELSALGNPITGEGILNFSAIDVTGGDGGAGANGSAGGAIELTAFRSTQSFLIATSGGDGGVGSGAGGVGGDVTLSISSILSDFSVISDGGHGGDSDLDNVAGAGGEGGSITSTSGANSPVVINGLLQTNGGAGGDGGTGGSGGQGGTINAVSQPNLFLDISVNGGDGGRGIDAAAGAHAGGDGGAGGSGGLATFSPNTQTLGTVTAQGGHGGDGGRGSTAGGVGGAGGAGGLGGSVSFGSGPSFLQVELISTKGGDGGSGGMGGNSGADDGGVGGAGADGGAIGIASLTTGIDLVFTKLVSDGGEGGAGGAAGLLGGNGGDGGSGGGAGNIDLKAVTVTANGPTITLGLISAAGGAGGTGGDAAVATTGNGGDGGSGGDSGDFTVSAGNIIILDNGFVDLMGGAGGFGGSSGTGGGTNGNPGSTGTTGNVTAEATKTDIGSKSSPLTTNAVELTLIAPSNGQVFALNTADVVHLSGVNTAGTYDVRATGDIIVDAASAISGAKNLSLVAEGSIIIPSNSVSVVQNGSEGGTLTLEASNIDWLDEATTALGLFANGTDAGGTVSLTLATGDVTIGAGAGEYMVSATGNNGGAATINAPNGDLLVSMSGLDIGPLGANGDGGHLSLTAQSISNTGSGPIVINQAAGKGTGVGGSIMISLLDENSTTTISSSGSASTFNLNASGSSGGSISFNTAGALLVDTSGLNLTASGTDGDGGILYLSGQTIEKLNGGTLVFDVSANAVGAGNGGTVRVEQTSATPASIGSDAAADFRFFVSGGSTSGTGGNVIFSSGGDVVVDPTGIVGVSRGKQGGDSGTISLEAGAGSSSGNLIINGTLSVDSAKAKAGTITLISDSATAFNLGSSGFAGNGFSSGSVSVTGKTNGTINVANAGGAVDVTSKLTSIANLRIDSLTDIKLNASIGNSRSTQEISLNAGGDIQQTTAKAKIATSSLVLSSSNGSVVGPNGSPMTVETSKLKLNVSGDVSISNGGETVLGDSIVGGTLDLTSKGSINSEDATDVIRADSLVLTTKRAVGDINPLQVNTSKLSLFASSKTQSNVSSVGSGTLALDDSSFNSAALQAVSDINVIGNFGTSKSDYQLTALGSGGITSSGDGVLNANSLVLEAAGGEIGGATPSTALATNASNLSANANGFINIFDTARSINIQGLTSQGDITVRTGDATKSLILESASKITSSGSITLQNSNAANGTITLGKDSIVETVGPLAGNALIFVGTTAPTPIVGPTPPNVQIVQNGVTGGVFFGANGISAKAPVNTLTVNNASIIFDTGALSSKSINLNGGVSVTAGATP